jgi:hypothetical protein
MNLRRILCIATLCVLFATAAGAQEHALSLTLLKTSIRTQNDVLNLQQTGMQAFLPTVMICPATAKKGCTLEIEVSSTFLSTNDAGILVTVAVTGAGLPGIDPDATLNVCDECSEDTRTFQWMQRSIPTGTKATVTVEFAVPSAGSPEAQATDRTETVQLFKN